MDKKRATIGSTILLEFLKDLEKGQYEGWGMDKESVEKTYYWLSGISLGTYDK